MREEKMQQPNSIAVHQQKQRAKFKIKVRNKFITDKREMFDAVFPTTHSAFEEYKKWLLALSSSI